jgi:hypothetical protein
MGQLLEYLIKGYLEYLKLYYNSQKIGDITSSSNMQYILEVMEWYLTVLEIEHNIGTKFGDNGYLTVEQAQEIKNKFEHLETIFKQYYYGRQY